MVYNRERSFVDLVLELEQGASMLQRRILRSSGTFQVAKCWVRLKYLERVMIPMTVTVHEVDRFRRSCLCRSINYHGRFSLTFPDPRLHP